MKKAIIVDLDGTLCNIGYRISYVQKGDWKTFFKKMNMDTVNEWCREIIKKFYNPGEMEVLLVTGRPADYEKPTKEWLKAHDIPYSKLIMRKKGDFRQDSIIKEEIYLAEIKPLYEIFFVVDDRKQVVDMWRSHGLTVLQCDEGRY